MARKILNIIILSAAALILLPVWAQSPPVLRTRMAPDTIMIGDHFKMEVDIDHDIAQELQLISFDKNQLTEDIEIISGPALDTVSRDGRNVVIRLTYTLTSFEEGVHAVTGYPVVYSQKNETDTVKSQDMLTIVVNTFEIDTVKQTIYDIKKPLNTPLQFAEIKDYVIYGGLIALALAAIIYLIVRQLAKRKGKVRSKPDEPPHITAIRELERLQSEKLWQNDKFKEYYSRLSDIVRIYIEDRYGVGAMEMTSPEIMAAMKEFNSDKLQGKLRELFYLADLVKFAKWQPSPDENQQSYYDAYYYVEETKIISVEPVTLAEPDKNA